MARFRTRCMVVNCKWAVAGGASPSSHWDHKNAWILSQNVSKSDNWSRCVSIDMKYLTCSPQNQTITPTLPPGTRPRCKTILSTSRGSPTKNFTCQNKVGSQMRLWVLKHYAKVWLFPIRCRKCLATMLNNRRVCSRSRHSQCHRLNSSQSKITIYRTFLESLIVWCRARLFGSYQNKNDQGCLYRFLVNMLLRMRVDFGREIIDFILN